MKYFIMFFSGFILGGIFIVLYSICKINRLEERKLVHIKDKK